ncbi:isopenicillin N synthase family dioxygenase [Novosphingobium aquimarinum]|uniref:isopenicillin N synthase family dioxygenase n=1 Tax=Novosphingobium aquimarinum TaxID=2682494 RepID=UPI0012EC4A31|nr:2-oxoglutarate and iron-dependent oxygenase domain-containing protein [Novosphingobium aquimarinum]
MELCQPSDQVAKLIAGRRTVFQLADEGLPVIRLNRLHGSAEEREAFIAELRVTLHDHGFFYLVDHGVSKALVDEMVAATRKFFALPEEDKMEIAMISSARFRGYNRVGMELTGGQQDWREQVDFDREEEAPEIGPDSPAWMRTMGPNQWPSAMPELRDVVTRYQEEMTRVSLDLLRAIALALGQDEDFFDPMFSSGPRQHMKILRYPGLTQTASSQGVGAHKDGGLITILLQGLPGLRVQRHDGVWIPAPPVAGSFIVNTGELLEMATDGFVRADVHAADVPPEGTQRFSIPFFLGASHDGTVPVIELPEDLKRSARGVSTDPDNPMLREVGANHLKARLRSHPDVAQRHYPDLVRAKQA